MKISACLFILRKTIYLFLLLVLTVLASYWITVSTFQGRIKLHRGIDYWSKLDVHPVFQVRNRVILIWSPLFEEWIQTGFLVPGTSSFKDANCSETRCEITKDRQRLLESDAVFFHVRTMSVFDIPHYRLRRQKWIFFSLEAPPFSRFHGFDFMHNMFNWTMSYRSDSDIVVPYGRVVHERTGWNAADLRKTWRQKTKMAVWMVSHCSTDGNREEFVDQLKNFVEVDVYGSCGFASCPRNKTHLCLQQFSRQYAFFLAFENALCVDYVTEKLFRTLRYSMIPVVFGSGNYSSSAPPHSFIDALSFSSPRQLADHMVKVASNFTEFRTYFEWRTEGYVVDTPNHCELCKKLHSKDFELKSVYSDINSWWVKDANCRTWKGSLVA